MFITSENYLHEVSNLIETSDTIDIAVAFWGEGSDALLSKASGKKIRVICNLASGGTNPEPIGRLKSPEISVRQLDNLHAKVVIGSTSAIVGSANFSTNGLQLEGIESQGWSEAGVLTSSPEHLSAMRRWFEAEWLRARRISSVDLAHAFELWKTRRQNRPPSKPVGSFFDLTAADVKDRDAFIIIWGEDASEEATAAYEQTISQAKDKDLLSDSVLDRLSFYEDWPDLPIGASLISFQNRTNGKYTCDGIWRRLHEIDVPLPGGQRGLQIVIEEDKVRGFRVAGKLRKELEKKLRPFLDELWEQFKGDNGGAIIPLHAALAKLTP